MIPSLDEFLSSLHGMWRMLFGDPEGLNQLNLTIEGFWRSFFVAVVVFPIALGAAAGMQRVVAANEMIDAPSIGLAGQTFSYILHWLCFILLMIPVSKFLGLSSRFVVFITVWNWRHLIDAVLILPAGLLGGAGLLSPEFALLLFMFGLCAALVFGWYVAKVALQTTGGVAAAIIILEGITDLLLDFALLKFLL